MNSIFPWFSSSGSQESSSDAKSKSASFLSNKMSAGPAGYGDPDDQTLRKVEREVLIPKIVREKAKTQKCLEHKQAFDQCCLDNAMMMVFNCRQENRRYQECLNRWFYDQQLIAECTQDYLKKRSEFRQSGLKEKSKRMGG